MSAIALTEGLLRFKRVESATFKVAEDDTSYPEVLGFTEGREVSVYLKAGELERYSFLERTVVQTVRRIVDQTKAVRVEITCKYGAYLRDAKLPATEPPPQQTPPPNQEPGFQDADLATPPGQ